MEVPIDGIEEVTLEIVLAQATEVIDRVLISLRSNAVRDEDLADIRSTVLLRLLPRLRSAPETIDHLNAFVVAATQNAVNDHLRRRYPERTRLKLRLRYLATHDQALDLWRGDAGVLCGLRAWDEAKRTRRVVLRPEELPPAAFTRGDERAAMAGILARAGGPILLDDVVELLAGAWNLREPESAEVEGVAHAGADAATMMQQRDEISALWNEIVLLPPSQRAALLLNLRDGDGANALALVVLLGVASFDAVAVAAGMTTERLAELWKDLPLDDNQLAAQLGVTRQQVINLRSSGRRRLLRRMEARQKGRRS